MWCDRTIVSERKKKLERNHDWTTLLYNKVLISNWSMLRTHARSHKPKIGVISATICYLCRIGGKRAENDCIWFCSFPYFQINVYEAQIRGMTIWQHQHALYTVHTTSSVEAAVINSSKIKIQKRELKRICCFGEFYWVYFLTFFVNQRMKQLYSL